MLRVVAYELDPLRLTINDIKVESDGGRQNVLYKILILCY
jgi:hypothetical protein